jgi:hypothetical protein
MANNDGKRSRKPTARATSNSCRDAAAAAKREAAGKKKEESKALDTTPATKAWKGSNIYNACEWNARHPKTDLTPAGLSLADLPPFPS